MNQREDIVRLLTGRPEHHGDGVAIFRCVEAGLFDAPERWKGVGHPVDYTADDVADIKLAVTLREIAGSRNWMVEAAGMLAAWRAVGRAPGVMLRTSEGWAWHPGVVGAAFALWEAGVGIAVVTP